MRLAALSALATVAICAQEPVNLTGEQIARYHKLQQDRRDAMQPILRDDWAQLSRYRSANAQLRPAASGEARVVFFGDSITDFWRLDTSFPGRPYVNRGISGQTTSQMLVRFRSDVIALHPKVVVILAGTNDLAGNTGPMSLEETEGNFASLAELATSHGIKVVFSSILPVHAYTEKALDFFAGRPMAKILELNRWLKDYCAAQDHVYLDYCTPMLDAKGYFKRELAEDGLHPNADGYKLMAPLAEAAIQAAQK